MGDFFAELKRRQMFRVAAAYAVVAWLLLQVVNNLAPGLNLPNWAVTLVIVLLAVGFPIALLFCWIQHLAPADGVAHPVTAKRDWLLIAGLALVIALISYQQLVPSTGGGGAGKQQQAGVISIAVLPFANLSGDASQEFFSDGMTEEITTALAKVQGLTVIGRTSAFEFKGQNRDLRAIGQQLGVTHLIEGSVRKDGNRVRISAQLIEANNGAHLWAENYDRNITDIFATQEDIAQAIAGTLKVPLGLERGEVLVRNRTQDLESYDQYLRARAFYRARDSEQAIPILEQLVERDADFAPAWALLGYAYLRAPLNVADYINGPVEAARNVTKDYSDKAENAARKAIGLDSRYAGGYGALATVQFIRGNWSDAEDFFKQALALDLDDTEVLSRYVVMLGGIGRLAEAVRIGERLQGSNHRPQTQTSPLPSY